MKLEPPHSLFEWAGGMSAIEKLMDSFYRKVRQDAALAPLFAQMSGEHPQHVARFVAEVLGGPALYSKERGGHPHMISRHLNRRLTQGQRAQWVRLLLEAADEVGMPDRSEEHTSELQSRPHLVCRLLLEKKKKRKSNFGDPPH